jgi:HEAT repeat protein
VPKRSEAERPGREGLLSPQLTQFDPTLIPSRAPASVKTLVKRLSGVDPRVSVAAARELGVRKAPSSRAALERALARSEPEIRLAASAALGKIHDPRSRAALETTLRDPSYHVRASAAYALSWIQDPRSTPALMDAMDRDTSALVRNACAMALGRLGDPRAIPTLERALDDESDRVRRESVLAIERVHDPEAAAKVQRFVDDPAQRVRIAAYVVLGLRRHAPGAEPLLRKLGSAQVWEIPALLVALGRIGTVECAAGLVRSADHPARWVRVCALHGLAEMRARETRAIALGKLGDESWAVRGAAALALGGSGIPADSERLAALFRDPSGWVRRGAVYGLGELGAKDQLDLVRGAIDDDDPEVQLAAVWASGRLADASAVPSLVRLLERAKPSGPFHTRTLVEGDGAVSLTTDADERLFDALVQALGRIVHGSANSAARDALLVAARRVDPSELDRPARLPAPVGADASGTTRRALFEQGLGTGWR